MSETQTPVHVRTIRMEAMKSGPAELTVNGSLLDERPGGGPKWFGLEGPQVVHRMQLSLRVRHPDLVITGVEARMDTHPYTVCPEAIPPLEALVGLSVSQGFTRAVNERIGRHHGCAHITALVHAMAPVVKQGAGAAFRERLEPSEERRDLWFVDTCHAWREHGPLHTLIQKGDENGLRTLSAYGRPPRDEPAPASAGDGSAAS